VCDAFERISEPKQGFRNLNMVLPMSLEGRGQLLVSSMHLSIKRIKQGLVNNSL
jgi:hypothetical protein